MVQRKLVYVWEFPVRFSHWINFFSLITLAVTGFYIGNPFAYAVKPTQYIMGWMRFVHFVAAYVFTMSIIIRLYWSFMGNRYARIRNWFPFSRSRRRELVENLKFYFFFTREPEHVVGHTALAGFVYLILFMLPLFQIVSGFALYSQNHEGFLWTLLGGWLIGVMNVQTIRLWHHLVMYFILAFAFVHVYIAWYLSSVEKNGLIGSIFNGYKFVTGREKR